MAFSESTSDTLIIVSCLFVFGVVIFAPSILSYVIQNLVFVYHALPAPIHDGIAHVIGYWEAAASSWSGFQWDNLPYKDMAILFSVIIYGAETFISLIQLGRLWLAGSEIPHKDLAKSMPSDTYKAVRRYAMVKAVVKIIRSTINVGVTYGMVQYDLIPQLWTIVTEQLGGYVSVNSLIHHSIIQQTAFIGTYLLAHYAVSVVLDIVESIIDRLFGMWHYSLGSSIASLLGSILYYGTVIPLFVYIALWVGTFAESGPIFFAMIVTGLLSINLLNNWVWPDIFDAAVGPTELTSESLENKIRTLAEAVTFNVSRIYIDNGDQSVAQIGVWHYGQLDERYLVISRQLLDSVYSSNSKDDGDDIVAALALHSMVWWRTHAAAVVFWSHQARYMALIAAFILSLNNQYIFNAFKLPIHKDGGASLFAYSGSGVPPVLGYIIFQLLFLPLTTFFDLVLRAIERHFVAVTDYSVSAVLPLELPEQLGQVGGWFRRGLLAAPVRSVVAINPQPLYVNYHYSCPPLIERLKNIEAALDLAKRKTD
ncbi:hypothetical protein GQ42DRAFT_162111 [Ramicandelaber brevisporus]|nr:hypothetical protein GQ42DRAFT_162111 [Ramicandelaber brevisporus]